jgi:two-component system, OmpR family, alkaline phosphatase synthesis response regulator PhoP
VLDGWEACRKIRASSDVPIIMLTARDDDVDKIVGLELGADDYLTKPFNPRELMARIRAVLRRGRAPDALAAEVVAPLIAGHLQIDAARREVHAHGVPLSLRAKEFDLLLFFAQNIGLVFSREKLLERVWGFDFAGETRTVDVHVAQLRKRIGMSERVEAEIETVFGVGYRFKVSTSALH